MPVACFYNFSDFPFTGMWNNEQQTFAPKSKTFMPAYLAQHFAKHLCNRELTRMGLDHATSPKAPEDQPEFYKLFRIAYIRERVLPGGKRNTLKDMIEAVDNNFKQVVADLPKTPDVDTLGADAPDSLPKRETSEQEDPAFTREGGWGSAETSEKVSSLARSDQPQVVVPPDFNDGDDDDYTGVPVAQQAPVEPAQGTITT